MRHLLFAALLALAACLPVAHADDVAQLQKTDLAVGHGALARKGDVLTVDYTGWLYDAAAKDHRGSQFDSSLESGEPFRFTLGAGQVIAGWDQGIAGMRVGGKRVLLIPARLAYGSEGSGEDIPPGSALLFEVELLDARPQAKP